MDNVQNCDIYIHILSTQTYSSYKCKMERYGCA
jgi:hypothetical protein